MNLRRSQFKDGGRHRRGDPVRPTEPLWEFVEEGFDRMDEFKQECIDRVTRCGTLDTCLDTVYLTAAPPRNPALTFNQMIQKILPGIA